MILERAAPCWRTTNNPAIGSPRAMRSVRAANGVDYVIRFVWRGYLSSHDIACVSLRTHIQKHLKQVWRSCEPYRSSGSRSLPSIPKRMSGTSFAASFAEGLSWRRRNSRLRFLKAFRDASA